MPTSDDALDARIDALEQSAVHRTPTGQEADGHAADAAWGHDHAFDGAWRQIAEYGARIRAEKEEGR